MSRRRSHSYSTKALDKASLVVMALFVLVILFLSVLPLSAEAREAEGQLTIRMEACNRFLAQPSIQNRYLANDCSPYDGEISYHLAILKEDSKNHFWVYPHYLGWRLEFEMTGELALLYMNDIEQGGETWLK